MSGSKRFWPILAVLVLVAACAGTAATEDEAGATEGTLAATDFVGTMRLEPSQGLPGTTVAVTGEGLPASSELILQWGTVSGSWVIEGERNEEYHGRAFDPVTVDLDAVRTDGSGSFATTFEVPEGFGFAHDVMLVDAEGVIRNQALFEVAMDVSVTPTEVLRSPSRSGAWVGRHSRTPGPLSTTTHTPAGCRR
jgi:hypothetical protein